MEKTKKFLKSAGTELSIFIILIVLILASSFISPYFLTKANFANIGTSFSYIGTIAAGLTVVMLMGGINFKTAPLVKAAGANVLVAGSGIYGQEDRAAAIQALREA